MERVQRKSHSHPELEPLVLAEALRILDRNRHYADSKGIPPWQYAVLISTMEAAGLSVADLRWLVERRYIEHAIDCTRTGAENRRFQMSTRTAFCRKTCFVLTETGSALARTMLGDVEGQTAFIGGMPQWDADRRELRVGETVVKRFRVPACNQSTILAAFDEEGWPERIDDPLPPEHDRDSRERLHNAIKKLNQGHLVSLLQFHGDGTGKGIRWRLH